jgi:hypothetical protein
MGWWRKLLERIRRGLGREAALSAEEREFLGEPLSIEATDLRLQTPLGPLHVPLLVRAAGRSKVVLRLHAPVIGSEAEGLLRTVAGVHWAIPEAEVCLLGGGGRVPRSLASYLRPGRGARLELWTWLLAASGEQRPLATAMERLTGLRLVPEAASLEEAALRVREDLRGEGTAGRAAPPARTLRRELAWNLGLALQAELGGEVERERLLWATVRPEGRFELDLMRWTELWTQQSTQSSIRLLGQELGRHLADPMYLLDPLTFVSSHWDLPPTATRPHPTLQTPMAAFVEMRAETALAQGAETPDAGDIVLECPGCHGFSSILTAYTSGDNASLASVVLTLYEQIHGLEHLCGECATSLSPRDVRVARYFRLLPDVSADVAVQLSRAEDGRIVGMLRVFAEGGRVRESSEVSETSVRALAGRCLTARAAWLELFGRALASGQVESEPFDGCSLAVAIPRGAARAREHLAELTGAMQPRGELLRILLRDLDALDLPFVDGTFHEWAGAFEPLVEDGRLVALLLVDLSRAQQRFEEALRQGGATSVATPTGLLVRLDRHRAEIPLKSRLVEAVHTGRYPEERALALAAECLMRLRKMEAFLGRIQQICGPDKEYRYEEQSGLLRVLQPGASEGSSFNLPSLLLKFGGDEDQLERMVRAMSAEAELSLERCRCGAPAYVSLKMKPPQWASVQQGSVEVVFERHNGVILAYSVDCEEHSGYISRDSLDRLGLSLEDLRRRFHRDLDHNDYQIGLLLLRDGLWPALGVVGTNAASLACHPALVRRALQMAGLELPRRVRLYSRSTDALVVTEPGAAAEFVSSVADKLDHILSQSLGLSSTALRFDELVELPDLGRGRLREVFRVSRP